MDTHFKSSLYGDGTHFFIYKKLDVYAAYYIVKNEIYYNYYAMPYQ